MKKNSPLVTGLSPIEGPPGTKITIRGENLGKNPSDLIGLTICGFDCLLLSEWKSPNKILARSGPAKGRGLVIVTTKTGGQGTCTVQFRGYHENIGPLKESAIWVEEAPVSYLWGRTLSSTNNIQQTDPLGLSSEENDKVLSSDELNELYAQKSGDITAENFSPEWFLLENHYNASFSDLKAGCAFLKRKIDSQKEGQLSFLKSNIMSILDQADTLMLLKNNFGKDLETLGIEPTNRLCNALDESLNILKNVKSN